MPRTSWKEASRNHNPVSEHREGFTLNHEDLQVGALMRIADAVEKVAMDREKLEASVKYWKQRCEGLERENRRLCNVTRGLRGRIKQLTRPNGHNNQ